MEYCMPIEQDEDGFLGRVSGPGTRKLAHASIA
jgi:hypothetical protein